MTVGTIIRYLFGNARAIQEVAASKAAIWTGIILVLLTSIPRNYDQTYFLEKPFLWVFGPLLFSLVSGTWLFLITYLVTWRWHLPLLDNWTYQKTPHAWRAFMGLFWLTAPIAWLYAIPVERFMDSVSAAKANVTLLGIVSLWRVLLMTRVVQVLSGAHFIKALMWILIPAAIEVLALTFFGGVFTKRILAGMMGMRNSPEEEVLLGAMSTVFGAALYSLPFVIIIACIQWLQRELKPLPAMKSGQLPFISLTLAAIFWIVLAIQPQRQVAHNWHLEQFIAKKDYPAAIAYAAQHAPEDFAPARPLPPKAYEGEVFQQLPSLIGAINGDEPVWLREHLIHRLDEMCSHWKNERHFDYHQSDPENEQIESIARQINWHGPDSAGFKSLLGGLQRFPEGQTWLKENQIILKAIRQHLVSEKDSTNVKPNQSTLDSIQQSLKIMDSLGIQSLPVP